MLCGYGVLLVASHGVRAARGPHEGRNASLPPEVHSAYLPGASGASARVAYLDAGPSPAADALPVLLLHGSPGSKADFAGVLPRLAEDRRAVAPDLPGFGASARDVEDYSIRAHAGYALHLLDVLGIERAHVVGFSMGGGVGLEMSARAPERVASLTLLSAIGVQELELLGDHHLNRAIHGLQLAALWTLLEAVPHFGLLDHGMLSVPYARNFYDSDQRGLREVLERFEPPMLILHGRDDVLVPFAAAREHERIVPQSELVELDGNHFIVFRRGAELAEHIAPFLDEVDAGRAPTRGDATLARIERASRPFDPGSLEPLTGFSLVVFLVLAALATLVSEDLTCIGVGAFIGQGRVGLAAGVLACFVGIYVGDILLFLAGRWFGRPALERAPLRYFLTEGRVRQSSDWFTTKGPAVIFLSRFLPGMRLPTYFAAGLLRTSFWRFSFWFALAAALWTPLLVWISSRIGGALSERVEVLRDSLALGLLATLALGFVLVKVARPLASHRGRRLLVGRWRRIVRWEYWPRWVFYPPVVMACLAAAIRHRSWFAFSAVNPAIPHGGFVGESKAAILRGLGGEHVARTLVLPSGTERAARLAAIEGFRVRHDLGWPLVVKPDVGERGDGVCVVRSEEELHRALDAQRGDVLVQEYLSGLEYGLFYARRPGTPAGELISIGRKRLPEVVGDGERDLEALILDDAWAVGSARLFLDRWEGRLTETPAPGERVRLGELGTHCRGAQFLEGADLETPELVGAVDRLAARFQGFHFGRFDVRAESDAALRAGRFRVLELNGVTSESAHVYDPRYSVVDGWQAMSAQWRLAYEIGAANAAHGARVSRWSDLWGALRARRAPAPGSEPVGAGEFEEIPADLGTLAT